MINRGKKNVIGILVDAVDYEFATTRILEAAKVGQRLAVSALAVHGVMTGVMEPEHKYRLNALDLVVPDGQPIRWAMNWLHHAGLKDRVYGPNLTLQVCERASEKNIPIFIYGSHTDVLAALCRNLQELHPNLIIAGSHPSFFRTISEAEKIHIVKEIKESGARLAFIGLGCPRQEVWIYEYRDHLSMPLLAVGAAFDFHAKTMKQAPALMQKYGLEWLYRLLKEPSRLWKRYLILNPLFMFYFFSQFLKLKTFDPADAIQPTRNLNYG